MKRTVSLALVLAAAAGCATEAPRKANIHLGTTPAPVAGAEKAEGTPARIVRYAAGTFLGTTPIYLTQPTGSTPTANAQAKGWEAKAGVKLRETLGKWTTDAGWALVWDYDGDLEMRAGSTFQGDFKAAVAGLFDALPQNIRIRAELRPDNAPPLLYVTRDPAGR